MFTAIMFIIGFSLGATLAYISFKPVHEALESLEAKHERLISIISQWQKKV